MNHNSTLLMTRALILAFISFTPFWGWSQFNRSIDVMGSLDYGYRTISTDAEEAITKLIVDKRNEKELPKLNWRIGVNFNQRLSNKFVLKTGLHLANDGYTTKKKDLIYGSEFDEFGNYTPDPSLPRKSHFVYNYWFAEIPLVGRFELNQKKFAPFVEAGILPSVYLTSRVRTVVDDESSTNFIDETDIGYNRLHLSGNVAIGVNYSPNENIQLFGQPSLRYHFTSLVDAPIKEHLYSFGLELGLRKKI